jgi:DNA processing protein
MLKELFLGKPASSNYYDETIQILRLIRSENVGSRTFTNLIKLFGNAKTALENVEEFSLRGGRSKPIKVFSEDNVIKELELLEQNNAKLITYKSPHYSKLLLQIPDFPPVISYKGNIDLLNQKSIAIVGARNASMNGRTFSAKIAKELVDNGYIITSGLARGIDTSAHQVSISHTIAVIAAGIDHIYPLENKKLHEQIAESGLIIAELPVGTKPLGQHFPQRNRLISGLSLGSVIIEASLKSGSLITAQTALDQNRQVFAVPGFPLDPRSHGTNKLIKEGAVLIESVEDIISNITDNTNFEHLRENFANSNEPFKNLNSNYLNIIDDNMRNRIIELLSSVPSDFEDIVNMAGLPIPVVHTIILELELAGNTTRSSGNKISLVYK